MNGGYTHCPKCKYAALPPDCKVCPACGLVFAKFGQAVRRRPAPKNGARETDGDSGWRALVWRVPARVDRTAFWLRVALLVALAAWGFELIAMDYRSGGIMDSFLHGPLLVFHEAGHVLFMPIGHWMSVLGGTLGQLLMPALLGGALLLKNRDPFGAAVGLWFLGVSLLDVAPYVYDALQPQLMLLSGQIGEAGGHDWIYLLSSLGWLHKSQWLGALVHKLGALTLIASSIWALLLLRLQHRRVAGDLLREE